MSPTGPTEQTNEPEGAEPTAAVDAMFVNLPLGQPLGEAEASDVLRTNGAPIVVLAGAAKSGKTTLLASLHDAFQRVPFAGYLAAGSRTLMGFEERCFDSRVTSGRETPVTQRTKLKEGTVFYHTKLRKEDLNSPIRQMLLADMSGEHYEAALDSAVVLRSLTIIQRADHFVHLVDGGKLASEDWSAPTRANAFLLMRRCLEERMLDPDARVDILLTKWDIVLGRSGEEKAEEILRSQREAFRTFETRVGRLRVTPIAARPHYKSVLKPGYGLDNLLQCWSEEPPRKLSPQARRLPLAALRIPFETFALREAADLFVRTSDG
jgi:Double-GTPase 2